MKGWSTEEMKDKPNSDVEEDTEEMKKWRCMSQEEVDQCWKKSAEKKGRGSGQVKGRGQQKRGLQWQRILFGMEACTKQQNRIRKWCEKTLDKKFRLVQRVQPAASAKYA